MTKILNYIRGDSRTISIAVVDSTNTPIDLTGGTVFFTVNPSKAPVDDSAAVISKSTTAHTNAIGGLTSIQLTNADTQSVTPGSYYYDVQVKDQFGNVISTQADQFQVIGDITRRLV